MEYSNTSSLTRQFYLVDEVYLAIILFDTAFNTMLLKINGSLQRHPIYNMRRRIIDSDGAHHFVWSANSQSKFIFYFASPSPSKSVISVLALRKLNLNIGSA
jgi:hypothetical protein